MKEIQLIPSGDGSLASQAQYHPRLGRNCLAERGPDWCLVLCDHLFLFVFIFFKETCAGGSLGRRGKLGSHTVVAACRLLGRNPIPKVGLQWGLCMHQLPCCKNLVAAFLTFHPSSSAAAVVFKKYFQSETTALPAWILIKPCRP